MTLLRAPKDRRLAPELMDQPDLDATKHARALDGLGRINVWSATASVLWRAIRNHMQEQGLRSMRVLDVASGGGDVPIRLWRIARRCGVALQVDGCDVSPRAVEYAKRKAAAANTTVHFSTLNVLDDPLPTGYDVITCSLFLHHLREDQAVPLLHRFGQTANRLVLVDDLRRTAAGMGIAYVGTRLLSRSAIVHDDGLQSVASAFTMKEALALAEAAGLRGARIRSHWPFRFLLSWSPP